MREKRLPQRRQHRGCASLIHSQAACAFVSPLIPAPAPAPVLPPLLAAGLLSPLAPTTGEARAGGVPGSFAESSSISQNALFLF